jgi:hypothetical protein
VSQVHQNSGESNVIFDDQQDRIARLDQITVIVENQFFR